MRINVKVKPNSSRQKIEEISKNNYIVHLNKPAIDSKANSELISVLKKHFKAPVKIIKGLKSKTKLVEVEKCQ